MFSSKFVVILFSLILLTNASTWPPLTQGGQDPDPEIAVKRDFIKKMMQNAWTDYERFAWGENELKPESQTGQSGSYFGNTKIGATIVDSLDTLYIMGMDEEFQKARDWVEETLNFDEVDARVSVFECNIRFIGGFLSAFALTSDQIFVDKAYQLSKRLLPAFDTPTGIPRRYINLTSGESGNIGDEHPDETILAELGTLHLEFYYLSHVTGDPIFREKVDVIREFMKNIEKPNGLYKNYLDVVTGEYTRDIISIGVRGDSYYEYLLKSYNVLRDIESRALYEDSIQAFIDNELMLYSTPSNLLYFADLENGTKIHMVRHLACFAGAMFAYGSYTDPRNSDDGNRLRDLDIGKEFTKTCRESYVRTRTHIGPEVFWFEGDLEAQPNPNIPIDNIYRLRPETIESIFYMWRITGDPIYRDWGWEIAQAIEEHCKVRILPDSGYSSLVDVNAEDIIYQDVQETFFLAETLKYLYLLFSSNDLISLDYWAFNTEAHLIPNRGQNPSWV